MIETTYIIDNIDISILLLLFIIKNEYLEILF